MVNQTKPVKGIRSTRCLAPSRMPEIQHEILERTFRVISLYMGDQLVEHFRQMARQINEKAIRGRDVLLEPACGTGHVAYQLALALPNTRIIGEDIDAMAIKEAQAVYGERVPNLEFSVGDVYTIRQRHSNLDLVVTHDSLHHFDDLNGALSQIHRALGPGGIFHSWDLDRAAIQQGLEEDDTLRMLRNYLIGLRLVYSDEECIARIGEDMERGGPLYLFRAKTASVMSAMAAYTSDELEEELCAVGFEDVASEINGRKYGCSASKPKD